jgi:hypoxanthine phosphoribosyltransferase
MNNVIADEPTGLLPKISPHFRWDGSLDSSLPEASIQWKKIIEDLREALSRAGWVPVVEFKEYPFPLTKILWEDPLIKKLDVIFQNPSLLQAGGRLVLGTPWNKSSNDEVLRIYYSYEQYEDFENRLVSQVSESHEHISYDAVVALPTGWVNLGIKAARAIGKSLHYAHVTSYDDKWEKGDIRMNDMEAFIASLPPPPARILLIDDLSDSGESLNFTKRFLEERWYTVETATIFEKEWTAHKPSFCVFRDFPKLWIVQPSEMYEGPVAWHNVHNIRNHPITQKILEVSAQITQIIDDKSSTVLEFVVPISSDSARVMMTVAKKMKDYRSVWVRFVSTAANDTTYQAQSGQQNDDDSIVKTSIRGGILSVKLKAA